MMQYGVGCGRAAHTTQRAIQRLVIVVVVDIVVVVCVVRHGRQFGVVKHDANERRMGPARCVRSNGTIR